MTRSSGGTQPNRDGGGAVSVGGAGRAVSFASGIEIADPLTWDGGSVPFGQLVLQATVSAWPTLNEGMQNRRIAARQIAAAICDGSVVATGCDPGPLAGFAAG
jgi:hypothetical protein